ncbi:hypothetical protein PtA15_9A406 [Puccinia triticina]|uniref:Uncharacterized protein n=1 Tax=Puccinia triticina TaxID=208348 RepID=A0ABY7CSR8_9BASI|nr:uncharacterized protein PtA15_9A406 [Puccinia triticina]WAQ88279.1 hypothetical protein PtA15_9A406 [Puccinia triticina]
MVEDGWVLVPEGQTGMSSLKDGIVEDELEKASDFGDSLGSSTFHTPINGQPVGTKNHAKPAHDSAQDLVGKASSKDEIIQEELERTSPSNPNKSDVEEKIKHAFSSDMKEENAEDGPKPASLSNSNGENFEDQLNQAPRVNQGQHELAPRFREAQFGLDQRYG